MESQGKLTALEKWRRVTTGEVCIISGAKENGGLKVGYFAGYFMGQWR